MTVNALLSVSTIVPVVMIALRAPAVAPAPIVIDAVQAEVVVQVVELTVIPVPLKLRTVDPFDHTVLEPAIETVS